MLINLVAFSALAFAIYFSFFRKEEDFRYAPRRASETVQVKR